jgi:hypothetical protein
MNWSCRRCGRTIENSQVAYRIDHRRNHLCANCAPVKLWSTILKCKICGRREAWRWSIPKHKTDYCSPTCVKHAQRLRAAKGYKRCGTCRQYFWAARSHARYCCNACRQKAYRSRADCLRVALTVSSCQKLKWANGPPKALS